MSELKRYTKLPFPPYTYIPGETPHPTRDPDGHSFSKTHEEKVEFEAEHWQQCEQYLYGIDLFNHRYWWEAHEALEGVWITAGRTSETGYFIQGLIQIAVAQLKQQQGFTDVAERMAAEGLDKMHLINDIYLGIEMSDFRRQVAQFMIEPAVNSITIILQFAE